MLIESLSVPKYRDLSRPGDDVMALLPGRLYAVFDGATDALGLTVNGLSSGRFAASEAARAMMEHALSPDRGATPPEQWLVNMNLAIAQELQAANVNGMRVGSTAAIVEDAGGDELRFLLVGDSGIRINGEELIWLHKDIDQIYGMGRAAIFTFLQRKGLQGDALEQRTRELVFLGLDSAGSQEMTTEDVVLLLQEVRGRCDLVLQPDALPHVEGLLRAGIGRGQSGYGNQLGHSLGYAVLNGGLTSGPDVLSFCRPKSSVRSVELFTDGYMAVPTGSRVAEWEAEFWRVETEDFSKTAQYMSTKGSTSQQFSDDRTVLAVHFERPT